MIGENYRILFQGDSVTDCGRDRGNEGSMGGGYPYLISSIFSAMYPDLNVKFINKGVSGDRVVNLENRWTEDCINLKPDIVSILIGINDCWRRYDNNDPTTAEKYYTGYKGLLERVKNETSAKVVILEPFVLPCPPDRKQWREDLDPKIQAARQLAYEFKTVYVPLDAIFASQLNISEPSYWAADGVHPSPAGHGLIALKWLEAMDAI